MGKKKSKSEYNSFLDGEKLRDNTNVRTSLTSSSSVTPPSRQKDDTHNAKAKGTKKPALTHFLCLPLVTPSSRPQLHQNLQNLKQDLSTTDAAVPVKAVRPTGTLHLTLGVMSLSDAALQDAMLYLQSLDLAGLLRAQGDAQLDSDALTVDLAALVPMQEPRKTSILYAEPRDASRRLVPFATALKGLFTERGCMGREERGLRLHATLVNTVYAKPKGGKKGRGAGKAVVHASEGLRDSQHHSDDDTSSTTAEMKERSQGHGPEAKSWRYFDARALVERYEGVVWAEGVEVDRVQICEMGAKKVWSGDGEGEGEVVDERYEVVCEKVIFG
ncbi:hypothetical protein P153DRAFT_287774 [Dothidotthia symphoricarpi CBS 119687]|uniref:A-kinase anchor protein 7-like phosphoesterase domain-containing protein n=1 Tax=Dothidotthia symphoricarpi CBS 119687 TaxID=1392245 RepID=A0A6A6AFZ9_9PLEO|nr:uncharacterized protein P153DRAFT_287774 [Dothidotthia symphoricarpi CBS 119687]KAF2130710.1 hypothetical protein P153DRAFT_287774 [Dothidotthia symphoricarpi CBS 119687]